MIPFPLLEKYRHELALGAVRASRSRSSGEGSTSGGNLRSVAGEQGGLYDCGNYREMTGV